MTFLILLIPPTSRSVEFLQAVRSEFFQSLLRDIHRVLYPVRAGADISLNIIAALINNIGDSDSDRSRHFQSRFKLWLSNVYSPAPAKVCSPSYFGRIIPMLSRREAEHKGHFRGEKSGIWLTLPIEFEGGTHPCLV